MLLIDLYFFTKRRNVKRLLTIERRLRNIEEELKKITEKQREEADLINEEEVAKWLGITVKSVQNRVYDGTMDGTYVHAVTGKRMYYKSKLLLRMPYVKNTKVLQ